MYLAAISYGNSHKLSTHCPTVRSFSLYDERPTGKISCFIYHSDGNKATILVSLKTVEDVVAQKISCRAFSLARHLHR